MDARYFSGVLVLLLGIGWLVGEITGIPIVSLWWPLLVILLGINLVIRQPERPIWPLLILVLGIALQLWRLGILPANIWAVIGALVLIAIGIRLLVPRRRHHWVAAGRSEENLGNAPVDIAVSFGEKTLRSDSQQFQGGRAGVSFGSMLLDLRQANLSPDGAELDLSVNFGSIKLLVPESWPLVVSGSLAFGAVEVRARNAEIAVPGMPALRLACTGAFGGIEITN